ncbi:Chromobox protein 8 [Conglomerata obtusa]
MTKSNESSEHIEEEDIYQVESILSKRMKKNKPEYYIKWVGYEECTWESEKNILDKEMIETFEKENAKKKLSVKRKSEDKLKNVKRRSEDTKKVEETKVLDDMSNNEKTDKDVDAAENVENDKMENENKKKQAKKGSLDAKEARNSLNNKKVSVDMKDSRTSINTKKTLNIDANIVAVEEVYKDKCEESITAKVRYKNGSYAILPMDVVHTMAPLPLIYYYESKMVFSESKDE